MLAILASVPGKLKTLLDRLTSTRAANLDKLDANITTRAAASTALSNAVWTGARAEKLDLVTAVDLPPIANGISVPSPVNAAVSGSAVFRGYKGMNLATTTSTSFVDVVNITGSGYLTGLATLCGASTTSSSATVELVIDGVTVASVSVLNNGGGNPERAVCLVGDIVDVYTGTEVVGQIVKGAPVYFRSSLVIRHKSSSSIGSSRTAYSYVKTS